MEREQENERGEGRRRRKGRKVVGSRRNFSNFPWAETEKIDILLPCRPVLPAWLLLKGAACLSLVVKVMAAQAKEKVSGCLFFRSPVYAVVEYKSYLL